jgi:hypothetical protein
MIGHIGRARKGPRANADLDEYSNYCRRSPERLVGVQLRGSLWGMDRRAHSRPVDCCSSRLHSSGVFCPAHRFGVEARCVKAREVRSPPPPTAQRRPWNGVSGLALVGRDELGCPDLLCARYPGLPAHSIWVGQIGARRSHDATCDQRQSQLARVSSLSSSLRTRPDPCSDARPSGGRPRAPCFHARATAFRNRCGPASAILVPWAHRRMSRSLEVLAACGDNGHSPPCFGWPEV